jgi:xylose isomerase
MVKDDRLGRAVEARYAGWETEIGRTLLARATTLEDAAAHALSRNVDELPVSGRQEAMENLVNEYIA